MQLRRRRDRFQEAVDLGLQVGSRAGLQRIIERRTVRGPHRDPGCHRRKMGGDRFRRTLRTKRESIRRNPEAGAFPCLWVRVAATKVNFLFNTRTG
jgi:hypothetical protein